jgi:4'-phosphopantetheinyl transferase
LKIGVSDFSIEYSSHGKPYLKARDDIFFSLSHSGNYAVCAIYDKEVGVDIEKVSEAGEKLIRKVTTDSEFDFLMSLEQKARNEEFMRLWTAKESYVKRDGSGFLIPPTELAVDLSGMLSISRNGKSENVSFREISVSGYKLTVCY